MTEVWKPLPYEPYVVSDYGHIANANTAKELTRYMDGGALKVCLTVDGKRKPIRVASAVLFAHGQPRPSKQFVIRYGDGNPKNCSLANLSWGRAKGLPQVEHSSGDVANWAPPQIPEPVQEPKPDPMTERYVYTAEPGEVAEPLEKAESKAADTSRERVRYSHDHYQQADADDWLGSALEW